MKNDRDENIVSSGTSYVSSVSGNINMDKSDEGEKEKQQEEDNKIEDEPKKDEFPSVKHQDISIEAIDEMLNVPNILNEGIKQTNKFNGHEIC
jgi:hypothetical protein